METCCGVLKVQRRRTMDKARGRSEGVGIRVKEGEGGRFTKTSTANKRQLIAALETRDSFVETTHKEQPEWLSSPSYTPSPKKRKITKAPQGVQKANACSGGSSSSSTTTTTTPKLMENDQVRLACIMFDPEFYNEMLRSEQPQESRGGHDAGKKGEGKDFWRRVAVAMCDVHREIHFPITCSVEDDYPPALVAKVLTIDLTASAKKWLGAWEPNGRGLGEAAGSHDNAKGKGRLKEGLTPAEERADVGELLCCSWWENIKAGYRVFLQKQQSTSGGRGDRGTRSDSDGEDDKSCTFMSSGVKDGSHQWTFCDNKLVNFTVYSFIDIGGGCVGAVRDYFSATLPDEMSLNTTTIDEESDTDRMDEALGKAAQRRSSAGPKRAKTVTKEGFDTSFAKLLCTLFKESASTFKAPERSIESLLASVETLEEKLNAAVATSASSAVISRLRGAVGRATAEFEKRISGE